VLWWIGSDTHTRRPASDLERWLVSLEHGGPATVAGASPSPSSGPRAGRWI
jgi:hypothetical protein